MQVSCACREIILPWLWEWRKRRHCFPVFALTSGATRTFLCSASSVSFPVFAVYCWVLSGKCTSEACATFCLLRRERSGAWSSCRGILKTGEGEIVCSEMEEFFLTLFSLFLFTLAGYSCVCYCSYKSDACPCNPWIYIISYVSMGKQTPSSGNQFQFVLGHEKVRSTSELMSGKSCCEWVSWVSNLKFPLKSKKRRFPLMYPELTTQLIP